MEDKFLQLDLVGLNSKFQELKLDESQLTNVPSDQMANALRDMKTLLNVCNIQKESIDFRGRTQISGSYKQSGIGISRLIDQIRSEIGLYTTVLASSSSDLAELSRTLVDTGIDSVIKQDFDRFEDARSVSNMSFTGRSRAATGVSRRSSAFHHDSESFSFKSDTDGSFHAVHDDSPPSIAWKSLPGINNTLFDNTALDIELGSIELFAMSRKLLAFSTDSGYILLFNRRQQFIRRFHFNTSKITCLAFNEDSSLLAVGNGNGIIAILSTNRGSDVRIACDYQMKSSAKESCHICSLQFSSSRTLVVTTDFTVSIAVVKDSLFGNFIEIETDVNNPRHSKILDAQYYKLDQRKLLYILFENRLSIHERIGTEYVLIQTIEFAIKEKIGCVETSNNTIAMTRSECLSIYKFMNGSLHHVNDIRFESSVNTLKIIDSNFAFCLYSNSNKFAIIKMDDCSMVEEFDINYLNLNVSSGRNNLLITENQHIYALGSRIMMGKIQTFHKRISNTLISHGLVDAIALGLKMIRGEVFVSDNEEKHSIIVFLESTLLNHLKLSSDIDTLKDALLCCSILTLYDDGIWGKVFLAAKDADKEHIFAEEAIDYIKKDTFRAVSVEMFQSVINHICSKYFPDFSAIETLLLRTEYQNIDVDLAMRICRKEKLLKPICRIQACLFKDFWQPVVDYLDFFAEDSICKHNLNEKTDVFVYLNLLLDDRCFPTGEHIEISETDKIQILEKLTQSEPLNECLVEFDFEGYCNTVSRFLTSCSQHDEAIISVSRKLLNTITSSNGMYQRAVQIVTIRLYSQNRDIFNVEDVIPMIIVFLRDENRVSNRNHIERIVMHLDIWTEMDAIDIHTYIEAAIQGQYNLLASLFHWILGEYSNSLQKYLETQTPTHRDVGFLETLFNNPISVPGIFKDIKGLKCLHLSNLEYESMKKVVIEYLSVFADSQRFIELVDKISPAFYNEICTSARKSQPKSFYTFVKNYIDFSENKVNPLVEMDIYTSYLELMAEYEPSKLIKEMQKSRFQFDRELMRQECKRLKLIEPYVWLCNASGKYNDAVDEAIVMCEISFNKIGNLIQKHDKREGIERKLAKLELIARLTVKSCKISGDVSLWIKLLKHFYGYRNSICVEKIEIIYSEMIYDSIQCSIGHILHNLSECKELVSNDNEFATKLLDFGFNSSMITEIFSFIFQDYSTDITGIQTLISICRLDEFEMLATRVLSERNAVSCCFNSRCELCLENSSILFKDDISQRLLMKFADARDDISEKKIVIFCCRHVYHLSCLESNGHGKESCPTCLAPVVHYNLL